jgi:DNA-binding transcriptional LysR family regulator
LDGLDADRLTTAPWVARERGSGTREAFEAALTTFGVDLAKRFSVLELPSNEAIRSAVEAGAGLAIMSRLVVDASIKAGSLIASPLTLPRRQFFLLRHKERYESQASRAFARLAQNFGEVADASAATGT